MRLNIERKMYPLYFIIPIFVMYILFLLLPGLLGIYYSFTDWSVFRREIKFVGFQNYFQVFTSNNAYFRFMGNTIRFTVISNIIKIIPAFFIAILLNSSLRGRNIFRAILYFPAILPTIIVGLIFRAILHPENGIVNRFFGFLNLNFLQLEWLADPNVVWGAIFAVDAWKGIGYVMTIFLAGLQAIPADLYESAEIDGADFWKKLFHVTIPMMIPSFTINLTFGLIYGLKVFDIIYVLTNGGPGRETEVISTSVFREFSLGNYAISSTLNAILFLFLAVISYLIISRLNKRTVEL